MSLIILQLTEDWIRNQSSKVFQRIQELGVTIIILLLDGGYCLPKDLKQLVNTFRGTNELLAAVLESNKKRKSFICSKIKSQEAEAIGIYRLTMKKDSDNFRESAIIDTIKELVNLEKRFYI